MKRAFLTVLSLVAVLTVGCGDDDTTAPPPADTTPTAPRNGLVAEYKFSGNANDTSGNANNGALSGGPTLTTDRFGKANRAYSLDGVDDGITTVTDQFATGNNVSLSVWFKVPSIAAPLRFFVMCSDFGVATGGANASFAISIPTTDNAAGTITAAEWHHLLGTYDGTNIRCYIDGVLTETTNHPGDITDPDRPLTFGVFGASYWTGTLDDVRVYNRVISSASEISNLYHEGGYAQ